MSFSYHISIYFLSLSSFQTQRLAIHAEATGGKPIILLIMSKQQKLLRLESSYCISSTNIGQTCTGIKPINTRNADSPVINTRKCLRYKDQTLFKFVTFY